jgi:ABC-2 type transport system ATP-binding protein
MAGRSFLLQPAGVQPPLLQRVLKLPQVSDGMIQGRSVRLILKKRPPSTIFSAALACRRWRLKRPRRALKMRLSTCWAARGPRNRRWAILHTVEGTPGETVIEANP